jgi:hypothetical protein
MSGTPRPSLGATTPNRPHALTISLIVEACHSHGRLIVIERLILGAFLVLPLLIVAFLFSDELWQEHRKQVRDPGERRIDWRHPLRSLLHRH